MLVSQGNDSYNWLDGDKHSVYILPIWVSDLFSPTDPDTWLPPDQLNPTGVLLDSKDEEQYEDDEEISEAEDHFDQPSVQQPMYHHDHFHAPP